MPDSPFRTLAARTVYKNPWIELVEEQAEVVSTGVRFSYAFLAMRPSVMVVALTAEKRILLLRQYRYPSREFAYELPGGGTKGVAPRRAARIELEEETGSRAGKLRKLGRFTTYCGLSDEVCHVFLATELRAGPQRLEETEHISVHAVSYERLEKMVRSGRFRDGMGLAALNIARPAIEELLGR